MDQEVPVLSTTAEEFRAEEKFFPDRSAINRIRGNRPKTLLQSLRGNMQEKRFNPATLHTRSETYKDPKVSL